MSDRIFKGASRIMGLTERSASMSTLNAQLCNLKPVKCIAYGGATTTVLVWASRHKRGPHPSVYLIFAALPALVALPSITEFHVEPSCDISNLNV